MDGPKSIATSLNAWSSLLEYLQNTLQLTFRLPRGGHMTPLYSFLRIYFFPGGKKSRHFR